VLKVVDNNLKSIAHVHLWILIY